VPVDYWDQSTKHTIRVKRCECSICRATRYLSKWHNTMRHRYDDLDRKCEQRLWEDERYLGRIPKAA
jgi:hypothetical protein